MVEREQKLGRSLDLIKTEMGLGASGFPHIGQMGDASRSYAVTLALMDQGCSSKLTAYSDDLDGLRKVPAGFPPSLEKYLGYPVSSIPDPYGCHESYGKHMSSLLLEALDACGIEYDYVSGKEAYEKGLLSEEVKVLLSNADKVGEIVKAEVGQERYTEVLPYFAVCGNCGRIYTTKVKEYLPDEGKVVYTCDGMEIAGKWIEGCDFTGETDVTKGAVGKLSWKGEFAARWKALDIRFEAYGKDIADSVRINDRISREILSFEPPSHAVYEMFLDKSGKKISKSAGNVFTPQVWFKYGSPQSLLLLMLKRFVGTRTLDVTDVPAYMDELDDLEKVYFGKKQVKDERELVKLKGLYEYCYVLKPPSKPSVHVPYNLLTFLAKAAPKGSEESYIVERLRSYSYLGKNDAADEGLRKRIEYAFNWISDFEEIKESKVTLDSEQKKALRAFVDLLRREDDAGKIQNGVFNVASDVGLPPARLFRAVYSVLLGAPQGPRLGPYILAMGKRNVIEALERALKCEG